MDLIALNHLLVCVSMHVHACSTYVCWSMRVEVREQLVGLSSLLRHVCPRD